jgi:hypothetical protein
MRARRRPKRSMRRKTKHLVLPRPFRWQVGEASNAHAVGEPAIDGRFDEIGCKEGKRDCHVNLSHAAVFALRDAIRACCWITDKFIKPATAAGNRCHQSGACLGTDRANVLRPNPLGQKNLTAPPIAQRTVFADPGFMLRLYGLSRRPKNRGPFQRVPVIAKATCDRLG